MRYFRAALGILLLSSIGLIPLTGYSGLITFETIPGFGVPTDGMLINTQFQSSEGITFSLAGGGSPQIAQVGAPLTAFAGPPSNGGSDNPVLGQGIGSFFLTDDGSIANQNPPALIVSYNPPTAGASGVILDMDFDEVFTIEARDVANSVLQTITINAGDPNTGDGIATPWSFDRGVNEVYSLRFKGSRVSPGGFGLGFDLFNAREAAPTIPEPSTLTLLLASILFLFPVMRRRA